MNKYLPIGSVVLLNDGQKRLMIIGYGCNNGNKTYDYAGCLYPEGIFNLENILAFDHEKISNVYYTGYIDDEETKFQKKLKDIIYVYDSPKNLNSSTNSDVELLDVNSEQSAM